MAFAHLSGIFPRSEELIAASRAFERGRLDADSLRLQAEEEARRLVALQEEWGFDYVTDGLLRWQDLLRPLADELPGVHAGPVTRWFDNNSFYRRPVIEQRLQPVGDAALRWTVREPLAGRPWKAILPTPWAFAALSEDQAYGDTDALLHDTAEVLRAEAAGLAAAGCLYIQFSDPVLVTAPSDGGVPRAQRALGRRESERKYSSIWVRKPAGTSSEPESESGWSSPCAFFRRLNSKFFSFSSAFA